MRGDPDARHPRPDRTRILAEDPGALLERVAQQQGATLREAIAALPRAMRRVAPGEGFVTAMTEIAGWGEVTVIVHTEDGIMEFSTSSCGSARWRKDWARPGNPFGTRIPSGAVCTPTWRLPLARPDEARARFVRPG